MKKIFGFKVLVNEKEMCRAGFEKANSVVTCLIDSIRRKDDTKEELNIGISGLNSDNKEHVDWYRDTLKIGDKVTIEVIAEDFDTPTSVREPWSEEKILAQKINYFHKLKEELKDHL